MDVPVLDKETWEEMNWAQKGLRGLCAIPGAGLLVGAGYALAGNTTLAKDAVQVTVAGTFKILEALGESDVDPHMPSSD